MPTQVKFTRVNKVEAMYERPRVKVERGCVTFHTLPLFYLRSQELTCLLTYARKSYPTVEIHPTGRFPLTRFWVRTLTQVNFNHVNIIEAR